MCIVEDIVAQRDALKAFARSLTKNPDLADDMVQETIAKAIKKQDQYGIESSGLRSLLFTILRNAYYSYLRRRKHEVQIKAENQEAIFDRPQILEPQHHELAYRELTETIASLPWEHGEALYLVCAQGLSYEEAAEITGATVGTMKSRVHRARENLLALDRLGMTRWKSHCDKLKRAKNAMRKIQ